MFLLNLNSGSRRVIIILSVTLALLWSTTAFCGPIHEAAQNGDLTKVAALLADNPDLVFSKDEQYGATPLFWAVLKGHTDVANLLISKKADVNFKLNGGTVLYLAVRGGYKDIVKLLLDNHADANAKTDDGVTPLLLSVDKNNREIVDLLLVSHADVNIKNDDGTTPLHMAAFKGYRDLAEFLLVNKADVNAEDKDSATPLYLAIQQNHKDIVELLLANNADVNAASDQGTPLFAATKLGFGELADLLRQHGGLPQDEVHEAASTGNMEKLTALLKNDSDLVASRDAQGETPLHLAAAKGQMLIVKLLMEKKADVNARDNKHMTPLHLAAQDGQRDVAELLLANGADVNAIASVPKIEGGGLVVSSSVANGGMPTVDNENLTPLGFAIKNGHSDVADLLRQNGGHE